MAETRWQVVDPQNRIRRLDPVTDGTVNVQLVLPTDDPAAVAAVEQSARDAGIELMIVPADPPQAAPMSRPQPDASGRIHPQVIVNGIEFAPVLPS